jgi:hypothetical protein
MTNTEYRKTLLDLISRARAAQKSGVILNSIECLEEVAWMSTQAPDTYIVQAEEVVMIAQVAIVIAHAEQEARGVS